ncbi:DUF5131 family protein [Aminobacter sp. MDW-2]|uniref:DUF5131 family protein n=1 Tax=Aminobacter sp. MDW-2 TaxID=2666139 RepID=UPI0012B04412|nr:DUF5131 family protein [Aminobacter sp. MDW-2]MRX32779.1 DUF5131 family protein [Aminobacter sp. MDW-2]QNH34559.1 DUF5131 family protein [Aminobacter sp. MDW-2]
MGEKTAISWCDHTFNPWLGCTAVSPACDGCYAEALMDKRFGRVQWGPHGERRRTSAGNWHQPIRWNKKALADLQAWEDSKEAAAELRGVRPAPPFVFCASLSDVFDNQVDAGWRSDLFELMRKTPALVWLMLTKRPQNILKMVEQAGGLPDNVALGTTCEDQKRWDINVPHLIYAKSELRPQFAFVSAEPLLELIVPHVPITQELRHRNLFLAQSELFDPFHPLTPWELRIDWIITGGASDQPLIGFEAPPTNPRWVRRLRDACQWMDTPPLEQTAFHHKQNGEWAVFDGEPVLDPLGTAWLYTFNDLTTMQKVGLERAGRMLDGVVHDARPALRGAQHA